MSFPKNQKILVSRLGGGDLGGHALLFLLLEVYVGTRRMRLVSKGQTAGSRNRIPLGELEDRVQDGFSPLARHTAHTTRLVTLREISASEEESLGLGQS